MGWPKGLFGLFHKMIWENPNEHFDQPNILCVYAHVYFFEERFQLQLLSGGKKINDQRVENHWEFLVQL